MIYTRLISVIKQTLRLIQWNGWDWKGWTGLGAIFTAIGVIIGVAVLVVSMQDRSPMPYREQAVSIPQPMPNIVVRNHQPDTGPDREQTASIPQPMPNIVVRNHQPDTWVEVSTHRICSVLPSQTARAKDVDGDGKCEDTNGNGRADFADLYLFYKSVNLPEVQDDPGGFDFNNDGITDMDDVLTHFGVLQQ